MSRTTCQPLVLTESRVLVVPTGVSRQRLAPFLPSFQTLPVWALRTLSPALCWTTTLLDVAAVSSTAIEPPERPAAVPG